MRVDAPLSRQEILDAIVENYDLVPCHIYLLDLIPLIEMIWADGKTQGSEISLLYEYVTRHLVELGDAAGGEEVVGIDEVNAFLDRFLSVRPDPAMLEKLRQLALTLNQQHSNPQKRAERRNTLLNFSLDIAAAAVNEYPYDRHERIMEAEKRLLIELMAALHLPPDRPIP
jgi:hypothetical protein